MNILRTATVAAVLALSAQVSANPVVEFTINLDSFNGQETLALDTLGVNDIQATSVYTNNGSVSQGTEGADLAGETLAFSDDGAANIESLVGVFDAGDAEFGSTWGLDLVYNLSGFASFVDAGLAGALQPLLADGTMSTDGVSIDPLDVIVPTFTDGSLDIFFNEFVGGAPSATASGQQLISFGFAGVEVSPAGVVILGTGDYSWYTPGTSDLVENFFIDTDTGLSFYDTWLLNPLEPVTVGLRFDFNVDGTDLPLCVDLACETLERTTEIDGSITFSPVPAPVPLALMGVGLLALGAARRRKAA